MFNDSSPNIWDNRSLENQFPPYASYGQMEKEKNGKADIWNYREASLLKSGYTDILVLLLLNCDENAHSNRQQVKI